jgi:putative hydrolase
VLKKLCVPEESGALRIVADLHTHTIASGHAYSTVAEMVSAASQRRLEMVGITDHGPAMPGGPHRYHFGNLRNLPAELYGVEILRGVEANILDTSGRLDLPEYYLRSLDLVLAGLHFVCYPGGSREENTQAVLAAMDNPYVDGIVHPGNPEYRLDYLAMAQKAAEKNILIEINNSSLGGRARRGSRDACGTIAGFAKETGALLLVSSDAHFYTEVGSFQKSLELIDAAGVGEEQIINTSTEKIKNFLAAKGRKRFRPS